MPNIPPVKRKNDEDRFGRGLAGAPRIEDPRDRPAPGRPYIDPSHEGIYPLGPPKSMKRGGMVGRTAMYRLHRGERVLPKSLARRYREAKHG